jgi:putative ABC transport system ATP-binding protein
MVEPGASGPVIRCRDIAKTYGSGDAAVHALRGVDLDLARGETLMLTGPSGCGKTTLLSILATLLTPDAGSCDILGHETTHSTEAERTRLRITTIGFVFQSFNLLRSLSARENVSVPLILAGKPRPIAEATADEALAAVGIADKRDKLPGQLSGGQQQRVAIARAIVHRPAIILCDEPTSALDQEAGQQVMEVLCASARDRGAGVIVVTHDLRITHFADRVVRMEDGVVLADEPISKEVV